MGRKPYKRPPDADLIRDVEAGMLQREIAVKYGASQPAVHYWMKRLFPGDGRKTPRRLLARTNPPGFVSDGVLH